MRTEGIRRKNTQRKAFEAIEVYNGTGEEQTLSLLFHQH